MMTVRGNGSAMTVQQEHEAFIEEHRSEIIAQCVPVQFRENTAVVAAFLDLAKARRLNPFAKQIYLIPRGNAPSIEISIDGLRLIAARSGSFAGIDAARYDSTAGKQPQWAEVTVYRLVGGVRCAFTARVYWREFGASGASADYQNLWKTKPFHMLAIRAEAHALRRAFPEEMGGIVTREEVDPPLRQRARWIDEEGEIHEPTVLTLPLGMGADEWARMSDAGRGVGVDFDPTGGEEGVRDAIIAAGGPTITGDVTRRKVREALDHMYEQQGEQT